MKLKILSFSVHRRFAMTILGHHSKQFWYIKMSISVHIYLGTAS